MEDRRDRHIVVYLDMNVWVSLARGSSEGDRKWMTARSALETAVLAGESIAEDIYRRHHRLSACAAARVWPRPSEPANRSAPVLLPVEVQDRIVAERATGRTLAAIPQGLNDDLVPLPGKGRVWLPGSVAAVPRRTRVA